MRAGATSPVSADYSLSAGAADSADPGAAAVLICRWPAMSALLLMVAWNMSEAAKVIELIRRAPKTTYYRCCFAVPEASL